MAKNRIEQITVGDDTGTALFWDGASGEAVLRWRGLLPQQAAAVAAVIPFVGQLPAGAQAGDVYYRSGWTFEQPLRNGSDRKAAGLGPATPETAARIAAALGAVLPEELQLGAIGEESPYGIAVVATADSGVRYVVNPGLVAAALVGTTTVKADAAGVRFEQYPERVFPAVVASALARINELLARANQ